MQNLTNRILTSYFSQAHPEKLDADCVPYYKKPVSFDEVMRKIDHLKWLTKVKASFHELYNWSLDKENLKKKQKMHMAFLGNPGTGKTTVAQYMADLLYSMGLIRTNRLVTANSGDLISKWRNNTSQKTKHVIESAYGGVLFIDEAYDLATNPNDPNDAKQTCLSLLLQEMEKNADRLVVIFAGYKEDMEHLFNSNAGLQSRIWKQIEFDDYTENELLEIFNGLSEKEKFGVSPDASELIRQKITITRCEQDFGNARTIEHIFQEIKAVWTADSCKERVFHEDHIKKTLPEEKGIKVPGANMHMLFTGNPGTGKTTVAKMIAENLYSVRILNTNKVKL